MMKTSLKPVALRRVTQLNAEVPARIELCRRAGGMPMIKTNTLTVSDEVVELTTVVCFGGKCEICGHDAYILEPREKISRGLDEAVSLKNSVMAHHHCYRG